jgi:hypothetical protein
LIVIEPKERRFVVEPKIELQTKVFYFMRIRL